MSSASRVSGPPFDPRLLGGLSPDAFLARHWQKKPLLVRGAVPSLPDLPDRSRMAELARRDDVESRLVTSFAGRWAMTRGPIDRLPRARRDWTLLVQGVNLFDDAADALMRRFDFVSAMRLDDLMISIAADGGGVGPHLDSYDVFLLQIEGRRRWRWCERHAATTRERALVEGVPLKLLADFHPTDEAVLEPGDLLYLPPSCAHEGVAIGDCATASIGFRAPSWRELTQEFLFTMAERDVVDGLPADPDRRATRTPAALDARLLDAITDRMTTLRFSSRDVEDFVGRHFTEPKAHVFFEPPRRLPRQRFVERGTRDGLRLDPRATLLYRRRQMWIAGEAHTVPVRGQAALRRLADRRVLDAAATAIVLADADVAALLHEWWSAGWLLLGDTPATVRRPRRARLSAHD